MTLGEALVHADPAVRAQGEKELRAGLRRNGVKRGTTAWEYAWEAARAPNDEARAAIEQRYKMRMRMEQAMRVITGAGA